jgi:S-adenosylmethionine:tRNA ribosyltransferase-isomerase
LEAYEYDLPHELIAQYRFRTEVLRAIVGFAGQRQDKPSLLTDITRFLHPREVLVLNNSAVIPARLLAQSSNGTKIESCFFIK